MDALMINIKKTLIVGDNEDTLNFLQKKLSSIGIYCIIFSNSQKALEFIINQASSIDLLILELNLKNISFLEQIKETHNKSKFKICLLGEEKSKEILVKNPSYQVNEFILSPIETPVFLNKIRSLLGFTHIELSSPTFAKVNFQATVTSLPILFNFEIIGISEFGILFESNYNFREQSIIHFNSRSFLDVINSDKTEHSIKIIKTKVHEQKFKISAAYLDLHNDFSQKIKTFATQPQFATITF